VLSETLKRGKKDWGIENKWVSRECLLAANRSSNQEENAGVGDRKSGLLGGKPAGNPH